MGSITLTPKEIRIAWRLGKIGYKLRNIQKIIKQEWLNSFQRGQKHYAECTRRLGKSTLLLNILTEHCIQHPGSKAGFYAPVKEGLKDYVVPIIEKVFSDCPPDMMPWLDSHLTLHLPKESQIIFRGSNNQQHRFRRGNDLQIGGVDEGRDVDELDNLIDSVVMPSLFTTSGRLLIFSTPADTEDHPLHAIKQAAERGGWYSKYTIYDCHKADPLEFTMEQINTWEKETTDKVAWQREFLAMWVKDPTKIIIPEWSDDYVQSPEHNEYFQFYHKYIGMDLGVRDKTAGLFGYYDFKKAKLIIEDEFTLQDSEVRTDRISEIIKAKEMALDYQVLHDRKDDKYKLLEHHEKVFRRVADNNNPLLINDLNSLYGLDFFATAKDELPAMINLVREWVKDGRILVNPSCRELIGCLRNAVWDKNKKDLDRSRLFGHFDALMALVYLVRNVDTSTNPIPKYYGKSWATHAQVPADAYKRQTTASNLASIFNKKNDRQVARDQFVKGSNGIS